MGTSSSVFLSTLSPLAAAGSSTNTGPAAGPSTRPAVRNGWDGKLFDYVRPDELVVEESTPTAGQCDWRGRPPQMTAAAATGDVATTGLAEPRVVEGMNVTRLRFKDADGDVVPVLLCTPAGKAGPFPVVVAVHGLTSHKAQVAAQVAPQLTRRGFAVLCPDMPRHGERPGDPRSLVDRGDIAAAFAMGRRAVNDVRQTIDLAEQRPDLDTSGGVSLVGYSLGSWINSVAGAADARVNAMVLMVGGAVDLPAMALLLPQVAATDPRLALAHFAGRPLLMLNGRHDPTVPADWARRLFAAAAEPKQQVWYDCGHYLPAEAYDRAAEWLGGLAKAATPCTDQA
ncbi:MAG: hypothetical protein AVDCRST_MAG64-1224 [uncultured Phycisphaerae bacterium]|uniref:Dienelactone hydrolase domain-containing protein n=1 Tax=uncultured Phycisphaerae bacterium TaxID=904963 RepID=A0A6J4NNX1_9BACT|nr:MAG: hypothetical protein AVDCRST_MAG64-1224 [uncultured Phycisphaerae bacterium]